MNSEIVEHFVAHLLLLADLEWQKRAWIEGEEWPAPTELLCRLTEDCRGIREFALNIQGEYPEASKKLIALSDMLSAHCEWCRTSRDDWETHFESPEVLMSARWNEIVRQSQEIIESLPFAMVQAARKSLSG